MQYTSFDLRVAWKKSAFPLVLELTRKRAQCMSFDFRVVATKDCNVPLLIYELLEKLKECNSALAIFELLEERAQCVYLEVRFFRKKGAKRFFGF